MVDPISLEVFKNLFISVCEEMGVALQRTAYSPNIKNVATIPVPFSSPEDRWWPKQPMSQFTWEPCLPR